MPRLQARKYHSYIESLYCRGPHNRPHYDTQGACRTGSLDVRSWSSLTRPDIKTPDMQTIQLIAKDHQSEAGRAGTAEVCSQLICAPSSPAPTCIIPAGWIVAGEMCRSPASCGQPNVAATVAEHLGSSAAAPAQITGICVWRGTLRAGAPQSACADSEPFAVGIGKGSDLSSLADVDTAVALATLCPSDSQCCLWRAMRRLLRFFTGTPAVSVQ